MRTLTKTTAAQRLLGRIHRRYQTVTHDVNVCGLTISFTRIADPDRVLDIVAEEETRLRKLHGKADLTLPYWAELWDSALGLAQFLVKTAGVNGRKCLKQKVLELGCGMGLTGAVAARLGARVLFADLESEALLFAQLNSLPDARRIRTRRLDWRRDRLDEQFDLILGADILYDRAQWQFLEPFWREHLEPLGQVLLAEPHRQTGDAFIPWIQELGWQLTDHLEPVASRPGPIRIFQLRPPWLASI